jgi:hypothetical protein
MWQEGAYANHLGLHTFNKHQVFNDMVDGLALYANHHAQTNLIPRALQCLGTHEPML